jgi:hypothetical protein
MNVALQRRDDCASFRLFRSNGTEITPSTTKDQKNFFLEIPNGRGYFVLYYFQNELIGPGIKWDSEVPYGRAVLGKSGACKLRDPSQNYKVIKTVKVNFAGSVTDDERTLSDNIINLALLEREHIKEALAKNFNYLNPVTELMHLPTYWSTEGPVPAYYFMEITAPPLDHKFVHNLLNIASEMNGYTSEEILKNLTSDKIAFDTYRVLTEMLTMTGTACFYNGDRSYYTEDGSKREPVERMMTPFGSRIYQGDCEDLAKECHSLPLGIQQMTNPGELEPLVAFLRRYEFAMVTIVATSPSLQRRDAAETTDPSKYICHVVTCGFPIGWFKERETGLEILWLEATNFTEGFHEMTKADREKKYRREAFRATLPAKLRTLGYVLPSPVTEKRPETMAEQSLFYRWVTGVWLPGRVPFKVFMKDGKVGVTLTDLLEQNSVTLENVAEPLLSPEDRQLLLACELPRERARAYASAEVIREWTKDCKLTKDFVDIRLQHPNELTKEVWKELELVSGDGWVECIQVRKHTLATDGDRGAWQIQIKIAIKKDAKPPKQKMIEAMAMYP